MALKDWKKQDYRYEWYNNKNSETIDIVSIENNKLRIRFFNTRIGYVSIKPRMSKDFYTKSQALKFAKSYMRKH